MMYTFKAPGPAHAGPRRANWQHADTTTTKAPFVSFWLVVGEWEGKGRGRRRRGRGPGRCLLGVAAGGLFGIWGLGCGVVRDLVAAADKQAATSHTTTTGREYKCPAPQNDAWPGTGVGKPTSGPRIPKRGRRLSPPHTYTQQERQLASASKPRWPLGPSSPICPVRGQIIKECRYMYNGWRCWSQLPGLTSRRAWGREHGAGLFNTREAPHTPGRGRQPAAQAAGGGMAAGHGRAACGIHCQISR